MHCQTATQLSVMNINQVKYFVSVYDNQSFSAAARQRGVTVQAISKALGELEDEIGIKLFDRSSRGAVPTPAGRAFYARATRAVEAFAALESFGAQVAASAAPGATPAGEPTATPVAATDRVRLALCVPNFKNNEILRTTLSQFVSHKTGVRTELGITSPETAQHDLDTGIYDALVTIGSYTAPNCTCTRIGSLPTGVVVSKKHPLAPRESVTLADLSPYPAGESDEFDTFNESIFAMYQNTGKVGKSRHVSSSREAITGLMNDELGYFFTAILPFGAGIAGSSRILPIAAPDHLDVPICLVHLTSADNAQYQSIEAFFTSIIAKTSKRARK